MDITNEKDFWEAIRNEQPKITVEGPLVETVTKHIKQLVSFKFMFFLLAIPIGLIIPAFLCFAGMIWSLSSGAEILYICIALAVLFVILGVFCIVCGILVITKGAFLKGDYKGLSKYRADTEYGVMTLTRK